MRWWVLPGLAVALAPLPLVRSLIAGLGARFARPARQLPGRVG
jgi:hypothetical protein